MAEVNCVTAASLRNAAGRPGQPPMQAVSINPRPYAGIVCPLLPVSECRTHRRLRGLPLMRVLTLSGIVAPLRVLFVLRISPNHRAGVFAQLSVPVGWSTQYSMTFSGQCFSNRSIATWQPDPRAAEIALFPVSFFMVGSALCSRSSSVKRPSSYPQIKPITTLYKGVRPHLSQTLGSTPLRAGF